MWVVNCANTPAGLDCGATQSLLFKQADRNVRAGVQVRVAPDTKKPKLMLHVPLGIHLPAGVKLQFGGSGAKALPFQICLSNGCFAEYAITQAEITAMLKGADLTLSVQAPNHTPFMFKMPAKGFAAAYAKIKGK